MPWWWPWGQDSQTSDESRSGDDVGFSREDLISMLEKHYPFPRQFRQQFADVGIEPEDYVMHMLNLQHRLDAGAMHARSEPWNERWSRFFAENPQPTRDQVFAQGNKMFEDYDLRNKGALDYLRRKGRSESVI